MSKFLRIQTHNYLSVSVAAPNPKKPARSWLKVLFDWFYTASFFVGFAIIKIVTWLGNALFNLCFFVGLALAKTGDAVLGLFTSDIHLTKLTLQSRFQLLIKPGFTRAIGSFVLLCFFGWAALWSLKFTDQAYKSKTFAQFQAAMGKFYLQQAQNSIKNASLEKASGNFLAAYQSFSAAQTQIQDLGGRLSGLLNVLPQKRDAEKLSQAGALLSKTGTEMVSFYQLVSQLKFSPSGLSSNGRPVPEVLNNAENLLQTIAGQVNQATELMNGINTSRLPGDLAGQVSTFGKDLTALNSTLDNLEELFGMGKQILLTNQDVLIFFANNNELRPVGGFLGTFGDFKIHDGTITQTKISSIYDLDGQLQDNIVPPSPEWAINNRWFLRDSNWFADFPASAEKMVNFYEKEGGETPQVIIVLTPNLVTDLLKVTGPISLPLYRVSLNSDNFVEQTQVLTSVSPLQPSHPKQMLADFFSLFLERLTHLSGSQAQAALTALQSNLSGKQMVFYSTHEDLQKKFENFNWAAQVQTTDRDYLEIVSANLNGSKTSLGLKTGLQLNSSINPAGEVFNDLKLTITNTAPPIDELTNLSYIRFLVPAGSELLENSGFDPISAHDYPSPEGKRDPDVYAWEKASVRDVLSGTTIGSEAGKTFFGNWLTLKGGETKTLHLVYKLPFKIKKTDHFSLMLQKQAGSLAAQAAYTLNFPGRSAAWKTDNIEIKDSSAGVNFNFAQDTFFGLVLTQ